MKKKFNLLNDSRRKRKHCLASIKRERSKELEIISRSRQLILKSILTVGKGFSEIGVSEYIGFTFSTRSGKDSYR